MRITTWRMSLSVGFVLAASSAIARSMLAPAREESPAPTAPAPRARPPLRRLRRVTRGAWPSGRRPRASVRRSSLLMSALRSSPQWLGLPTRYPGFQLGNGGCGDVTNSSTSVQRTFNCRSRAGHLELGLAVSLEWRGARSPRRAQAAAGEDDVVDDPVVPGLGRRHVVVAVDVPGHLFEGAPGVMGDDLGHAPGQR